MQGISEEHPAQTSVNEYNAGRNARDGSFLCIDDPKHFVLSVNSHDPGLPPFREGGEEELRIQHRVVLLHQMTRNVPQVADFRV